MTIRTMLQVTCVAVALTSLAACQKGSETTGSSSSAGKDAKLLVTVNGTKVTTEDFDREVKALPDYIRAMANTPQGKKELLDNLVMRELILQQAAKDGLDKGKDLEERMAEVKKRIVVDLFLKKKVETEAKISDEELKGFYEKNLDKFKSGEQIRASHILVKAESEAQAIQEQLKKGGNFEELAKSKSVDSSAAKGGDLGWFGKGNMVPAFEKAAFALKEGQVSGIVKSDFGFHIIKLTGKRAAGTRPFDEVKEQIKSALLPQKQQQAFMKLKEDLKKGAKVEFAPGVEPTPATAPTPQPQTAPAQPAAVNKK